VNNELNTGGPAFPFIDSASPHEYPGMTLRDYFAAKALQGMMAVPDDQRYGDRADKALTVDQWQIWCVTGLVEHAYRVADAMIKARNA
jgi:glycerol kinase